MSSQLQDIAINGLWRHDPATRQLLGLCPLLAVSQTASNALWLGLATIIVLIISNGMISLLRPYIARELRIPFFILIIASSVTILQLLLQGYAFSLYEQLGLFLALITTNCTIMARAEAFASRQSVPFALWDGLMQGLGFALVLITLGMLRELIAQGSLFSIPLLANYPGFLLALLPPGAFILLALLIALKNYCYDAKPTTQTVSTSPSTKP